jgi:AraC-like DNA-binding protein
METDGVDHCIQFRVPDAELAAKVGGHHLVRNIRSRAVLKELEELTHWQEEDSAAAKDLRLSALLLSLLWEADHKDPAAPDPGFHFASAARQILATELDAPPPVKEMAQRLGVSGDYLRHLFKRHFGIGIKEFSLEKRLEKARGLLLHSPLRLKEIAAACGFANERAFCTAFKAHAGVTPGEFKRR